MSGLSDASLLKFSAGNPSSPEPRAPTRLNYINVLGNQREADLDFIDNTKARRFIKSLPYSRAIHFSSMYPHADPLAVDLLQQMLIFDPSKRIMVVEALHHPYMSGLYDPTHNPPAQVQLNLDVDENMGEAIMIRELVLREMFHYHPETANANTLAQS
ncbi:mitogen-activated protein kinase 1 [Actinidia rufa]|uniref:Mitogen-activated protein kinase 1 n=1 Tax=Actinidia rufa TaxID=165716 RepID=A0A7J0FU82_9ERIC|nr:mitogen-activated protein kinase 1 [Actinidia rufa]